MKYAKILSTPKFRAQKSPRCAGSLEKMMELLKTLNFWLAVVQFIVLGWLIYASRRDFIAKEAADDKKPLLSDASWTVMRPGDTALIMLKLDQMSKEQQARMMKALIDMRKAAQERGVDLIAVPGWDHEAVVVRGALSKQGNNSGQSTNDSARQRDPAWGQVAAHP